MRPAQTVSVKPPPGALELAIARPGMPVVDWAKVPALGPIQMVLSDGRRTLYKAIGVFSTKGAVVAFAEHSPAAQESP